MWEKKRYHEIMFVIDTCQAASMYKRFRSPNIIAAASSLIGEPSYSHHVDKDLGVAVVDRFTHRTLQTLERMGRDSQDTLKMLFDTYNYNDLYSNAGIRVDLFPRGIEKVCLNSYNETLITDFFGGVQNIELTLEGYDLDGEEANEEQVPLYGQDQQRAYQDESFHVPDPKLVEINARKSIPPSFWIGSFLFAAFMVCMK